MHLGFKQVILLSSWWLQMFIYATHFCAGIYPIGNIIIMWCNHVKFENIAVNLCSVPVWLCVRTEELQELWFCPDVTVCLWLRFSLRMAWTEGGEDGWSGFVLDGIEEGGGSWKVGGLRRMDHLSFPISRSVFPTKGWRSVRKRYRRGGRASGWGKGKEKGKM